MLLKKLFGGIGKNKEKAQPQGKFYLELKDTDAPKTDVSVAETAAVVVGAPQLEQVPEPIAAEVSVVEGDATERTAKEGDKKKDKKAADKKTSSAKGKGGKEAAKAAPAAKPPAPPSAEELIRQAVNNTSNGKVESEEVLFAASSAIGSTLSRRRPGPSLNTFKDMARQAKVPTPKR